MALTLVLFSVVAAKTFSQIDAQALDIVTWVRLFGINGLRYLPHLLAIATYLAAFNTSTRYWQDGEIWVWRNAGVTPVVLLKQLALYIIPLSLGIALFSGWIVPWSYQQGALEQLAMARTPFTHFSETGRFLRFPSGLTVRIEGKTSETGKTNSAHEAANSVFVFRETGLGAQTQHASIWAKSAQLEPQNERVALTLKDGALKQYRALDTEPKVDMRFKALHYFFALPNTELDDNPKWMSWPRLWTTHNRAPNIQYAIWAERFWRLSFPLHVLIITWIAWSLGRHNTRSGQSAHILSLILIDQLYLNLIDLLQTSIGKGQLSLLGSNSAWMLHALFAFAAWHLWLRQSR